MISRRNFLKTMGLASTSMLVPNFLQSFAGSPLQKQNGKILVVVQWSGGNDGLNTLVPFRNDLYYQNRPSLALPANELWKISDELGFNNALSPLRNLYDEGNMGILNNVGYPNPDRSHFRSMDIWQTASDSRQYWTTGWLGRYLDSHCQNCPNYQAIEVDDTLNLALKGKEKSGFAMREARALQRTTQNRFLQQLSQQPAHREEENVAYLYKTLADTQQSAQFLLAQSNKNHAASNYPQTPFGKDLQQIANLILTDTPTQVYYVNLTGFDTHANQRNQQARLLKMYAEAMQVFVKDLQKNNRWQDVLVMTFSEFGRRVKQNGSNGTDHGTANNVYLLGGKLKKSGILNEAPNLSSLDEGDLIYSLDFRKIYANILENWLQTDATSILQGKFEGLNLV